MDSLELMDSRTARRWFALAFGSAGAALELPKTWEAFLQIQQLLADHGLLQRIATLLGTF